MCLILKFGAKDMQNLFDDFLCALNFYYYLKNYGYSLKHICRIMGHIFSGICGVMGQNFEPKWHVPVED